MASANSKVYQRPYVSQWSETTLGVTINIEGVPTDPDGQSVDVTGFDEADVQVFTRAATRESEGVYSVTLTTEETQTPGNFSLVWEYDVGGDPESHTTFYEVGWTAPAYDALPGIFRQVVEDTWVRFADLYDSPDGGPHLATYVQTDWGGRNRLAQLLKIALGRLNTVAQPHQTYGFDEPNQFPVQAWGALLEHALYVECIKHLMRSYVEQPALQGMSVAYEDRRDYMNRWNTIYEIEKADLDSELSNFKLATMGLGAASVTVAGGVYGNIRPFPQFANPARPQYWMRYY